MTQKSSSEQLRGRFLRYKNIPGTLWLSLLAREDAAVAYLEQETRQWRRKLLQQAKDPMFSPEDLFHDAIVVLYSKVTKPDTIAALSLRPIAYVKQICIYLVKNQQRRKREQPVLQGSMPGGSSGEQEVQMEAGRMEKALAMLSEACQEVLKAFFWHGKKDKMLSKELGMTVSALKSRRSRCRKELIAQYHALPGL